MAFAGTGKIWMNGKLVDWADANDPRRFPRHPLRQRRLRRRALLRHAEGLGRPSPRCPHQAPARVGQDLPHGLAATRRPQLETAVLETIRANGFKACYIRPLMYRGYNALGVNPLPCPGRRRRSWSGNGAHTSAPTRSRRAWTSASARGTGWRRTRFRRSRRRAATTRTRR